MQNVIEIKINIQNRVSFIKQAGVSSLLFIVLVGLSLTVLTVGYMSTMRNLQSSATTTHAQTQAQMQAMVGYHALTKYLKKESLTNIAKIESGTVSGGSESVEFTKVACGGAEQYCFDLVGKSGGASAVLRAHYNITSELSNEQLKGSVFEGGLKVNSLNNLTASDVTLEIGGGKISEMGGSGKTYTEAELIAAGIKVVPYQKRDFMSSVEARKYANYIFYMDAGVIKCKRNNFANGVGGLPISAEIDLASGDLCKVGGVSRNSNNTKWVVNSNNANMLVGVLWFDGDVEVNVWKSKVIAEYKLKNDSKIYKEELDYPNNILKNTIITTGKLESMIVESNKDSSIGVAEASLSTSIESKYHKSDIASINFTKVYDISAPHHYVLNALVGEEKTKRLEAICPVDFPTQYCVSKGVLKSVEDMQKLPANIANILYLATNLELIGGKEQQNVIVNYYGNLMANSAAGGTGGSSGKLVGTGTVRIEGNLMVVGSTDMTEMTGDFKLNLSKADDPGNFIPVHKKIFAVGGIRYM